MFKLRQRAICGWCQYSPGRFLDCPDTSCPDKQTMRWLYDVIRWTREKMGIGPKYLTCPDCGCSEWLQGPSGGAAINMKCNACESVFNVGMLPGGPRILEKIR